MRFFLVTALLWYVGFATTPSLMRTEPFGRNSLISQETAGLTFLNPQRFSMSQSYSTTMGMGGGGQYSYGMYLNHMSYQLFSPLTLYMDMGFYTPFQNSGVYNQMNGKGQTPYGSLVLPRFGLTYQPSDRLTMSLQFMQAQPGMVNPYYLP